MDWTGGAIGDRLKRFMAGSLGLFVVGATLETTMAQTLDEKAVTVQANALGPPKAGRTIAGIPVADIRWLMDRQEIRDCLTRYVRGLDRHDELLIASVFWPDAHIVYGDTFSGTRDTFVRWALADDTERMAAHGHNVTQQTVEIDGDVAHVESYLLALEQHRDLSSQIVAGRYIDRMERRHGEWRIAVRRYLLDTKANVDGSGFEPGKSCRAACGALDKTDLSYERPLVDH
jgi:hypothetical protein